MEKELPVTICPLKEFNLSEMIWETENASVVSVFKIKEFIRLTEKDMEDMLNNKISKFEFAERFEQRLGEKLK